MGSIQSEIQMAKKAIDKNDYDSARDICIAALNSSEPASTDRSAVKDRMDILLTLSDISIQQERMFDNINYLRDLTKLARSSNDVEMLAKGHIKIGFVFNRMGKRDRAMDKFNEAEELTKNFKNKIQYGYVLAGKANIYWRTGDSSKALELAKKVLEIGLENEEFKLTAGGANIMSAVLFELGDFEEALKVAVLSVETYRNFGNKSELARALNNQGEIYKRMKEYDKAMSNYLNTEKLLLNQEQHRLSLAYLYGAIEIIYNTLFRNFIWAIEGHGLRYNDILKINSLEVNRPSFKWNFLFFRMEQGPKLGHGIARTLFFLVFKRFIVGQTSFSFIE